MRLTQYGHSCVRLDDGRALVIDPGVFSEADAALDGADAVLITHEHPDHLNAEAVRAAAATNRSLRIWAPAAVADSLSDLGDQVTAASPGDSFEAAGFTVEAFGGQHALIHPSVPMVANIGYLVDGALFHPGDSFTVPNKPVRVLLVPIHAPWSKVAEVMDFVVAVRAARAFQIHDGLLNESGLQFSEGHVGRIGAAHGTEFTHLDRGQSVEL